MVPSSSRRCFEESMEEAPICALGGTLFRLPMKLDGLLRHGSMLPKGAEEEIPLIKHDLKKIIAILHGHISRLEVPPLMVNCWMKEVRELSYDIEDCIDQYDHAAGSNSKYVHKTPRRRFASRKTNPLHEKLTQRLRMANKIREFSVRVQEALQRHEMYNLGGISRTSADATIPICDALLCSPHRAHSHIGEPVNPVGIDAPVNKLEEWLIKDGEQKLKVVAILGPGGVGKTTLANELYCKLGGQFECQTFVRASQKPDMRRLLSSMLSQVRPQQPPHTWKVHNLIAEIRKHLQDKRYLIVVDGVWATATWDIISCVLPDDNHCSRVLITTEIEDVAHKCCGYDSKYVFKMEPLGDDDSRKLFLGIVFGSEHECPSELTEVSNNIIRKCGGFPLATVTTASLFASQMSKPEQLDYLHRSLGYGLRKNATLDGMKQVLNLSYTNLPHHLKTCILYISIYEEDYIIWKDDLVKQWIAEGFICATVEQDKEEIAGSYFNDLVSRRMIQPVHINDNDEVLSCVVHHMVLNLISFESMQDNFAISIDHSQTTIRLSDKVRRLSLHFGNTEDVTLPTNMILSQVRTLAVFGVLKCVPSIAEFRLLQVMILHFWGDEESISFDLTRISELFRLRYLQVTCNVTLELRTQIRGLQCLEALKIDARASAVPSDIVHLPGLLHLNLPAQTNLPSGIGHMTSLRTLGCFDLRGNSIENVCGLGELTNLRDLQLTCHNVQSDNLNHKIGFLGLILWKLRNLKSLSLIPAGSSSYVSTLDVGDATRMSISGDGLSCVSSPPVLLQRLELLPRVCIFSNLPKWIAHLCSLCVLKIGVRKLTGNDVRVLGGLPALTVLSLYLHINPRGRLIFDKAGFLVLKCFKFRCGVPLLKFEADSMPNLRKLKLGFSAEQGTITIPVGIEHLSGLKEISAKIGCDGAEESYARSVEFFLGEAIRMHPGRPNVNIQCVDGVFGGTDDKSSRTQEEEHLDLGRQDETIEPARWKLAFRNHPRLPIFTGRKIEDANGDALQIIFVDVETGSQVAALPQPLHIELVLLPTDFPPDDREEWVAEEFEASIVKERSGSRPLLTGDVCLVMRDGCVTVNELQFTDNSSWVRIGVRAVPGSFGGVRILEALSEVFVVRDHPGELHRKHYPPRLGDEVWRLEKIAKDGVFHRKLSKNQVLTVQDFLRMLMVQPDQLRAILGDAMTHRMWEATTSHARCCIAGDEVYAYSWQHATIYVDSIFQILKIEFGGVDCAMEDLNEPQKAYVRQLRREAYEQRNKLQQADASFTWRVRTSPNRATSSSAEHSQSTTTAESEVLMAGALLRDGGVDHHAPLEPLMIQQDLTIESRPIRILGESERDLRHKTIKFVRVLWTNQTEREATWELEYLMREKYPELFTSAATSCLRSGCRRLELRAGRKQEAEGEEEGEEGRKRRQRRKEGRRRRGRKKEEGGAVGSASTTYPTSSRG